jgi:phospholipase D1/2
MKKASLIPLEPLIPPGLNAEVEQAELLVDAENYYASFCRAALRARRHIYMTGWQFDSLARLSRPEPRARSAGLEVSPPLELLPFLEYLCARSPELEVFIMAWDYSLIYALEREWLQKLKFEFQSHPRVHFEFQGHPGMGGCLHQKYVVVDDCVAFVGGLDVCDARWDTREHLPDDPRRLDVHGKDYKSFHDLQIALRGPVVRVISEWFRADWHRARGERLAAVDPTPDAQRGLSCPDPALFELSELNRGRGLRLRARQVGLSRTDIVSESPGRFEVQELFERAIWAAERLIYIEVQYFTSRVVAEALCRRFADTSRGKLCVLLVMPDGADTPKENLVLGAGQRAVRRLVADVAQQHGHDFRWLMSRPTGSPGAPATFIHSKLLIVDDELLSVGSANLTNRSMSVDSELNVTCATALESPAQAALLREDIRAARNNLLAEHAGSADLERFASSDGLLAAIDAACDDPASKLERQDLPEPEKSGELLMSLFDPSNPLDWEIIDQTLAVALRT